MYVVNFKESANRQAVKEVVNLKNVTTINMCNVPKSNSLRRLALNFNVENVNESERGVGFSPAYYYIDEDRTDCIDKFIDKIMNQYNFVERFHDGVCNGFINLDNVVTMRICEDDLKIHFNFNTISKLPMGEKSSMEHTTSTFDSIDEFNRFVSDLMFYID